MSDDSDIELLCELYPDVMEVVSVMKYQSAPRSSASSSKLARAQRGSNGQLPASNTRLRSTATGSSSSTLKSASLSPLIDESTAPARAQPSNGSSSCPIVIDDDDDFVVQQRPDSPKALPRKYETRRPSYSAASTSAGPSQRDRRKGKTSIKTEILVIDSSDSSSDSEAMADVLEHYPPPDRTTIDIERELQTSASKVLHFRSLHRYYYDRKPKANDFLRADFARSNTCDALRLLGIRRWKEPRRAFMALSSMRPPDPYELLWFPFTNLRLVSPFLQASGVRPVFRGSSCVNRIVQTGDRIVVASAAVGGDPDDGNMADRIRFDPYNESGNLLLWRSGRLSSLCSDDTRSNYGHVRKGHGDMDDRIKYYSVHGLSVDPLNSDRFLTCGDDGTIRVWEDTLETGEDTIPSAKEIHKISMQTSSGLLDVHHRPGMSDFAVPCTDGRIHLFLKAGSVYESLLIRRDRRDVAEAAGAMVWGCNSTKDMLFASSETEDDSRGTHRAFALETAGRSQVAYEFDLDEAGDAMAISPCGNHLAIVTTTPDTSRLRIFDVRDPRKPHKPVAQSPRRRTGTRQRSGRVPSHASEPFQPASEPVQPAPEPFQLAHSRPLAPLYDGDGADVTKAGEVNVLRYSPCGTYLAAGRRDNVTEVYDPRFLGKTTLYTFAHTRQPGGAAPQHGVVDAQWMYVPGGGGLGLVTGGSDFDGSGGTKGCVRLWSPKQSDANPENGRVIADVESDMSCFSLGDPWKGEKMLVVGDSAGNVSIFDRSPIDFSV